MLKFNSIVSAYIPRPGKARKNGDDAHFLTSDFIGVADGVGGWEECGIDPSLFSNELMRRILQNYHHPMQPLSDILRQVLPEIPHKGSSTVCLCSMTEDGEFEAYNVGDSCFFLCRKKGEEEGWKIILASKDQQSSFNCPYQVSSDEFSQHEEGDHYHTKCQEGDILIMATDGLTNNLFIEDICSLLPSSSSSSVVDLKKFVNLLIWKNLDITSSKTATDTPFHKSAKEYRTPIPPGGKLDDVTIIAAHVGPYKRTQFFLSLTPEFPAIQGC